jgi:hypothetical protein
MQAKELFIMPFRILLHSVSFCLFASEYCPEITVFKRHLLPTSNKGSNFLSAESAPCGLGGGGVTGWKFCDTYINIQ